MQWEPESRGQALTGDGIPMAFKDLAPQVSDCETLFLNLAHRRLLPLYQPPCCMVISLPGLLETILELAESSLDLWFWETSICHPWVQAQKQH